jgi:mannose-6-phosphate isomerase-like protein (cupin superfamily)
MKISLFYISLLFTLCSFSQNSTNLIDLKPDTTFENILIKKLDSDTNSTSFVIWIKKGVKSHKHEKHSEIISVIAGSGNMIIDNESFKINRGDYFRIPKNTFHSLVVSSKKPMKVLSIQSPEFKGKDRIFEESEK